MGGIYGTPPEKSFLQKNDSAPLARFLIGVIFYPVAPKGAAKNIDNQVKQEWHQHYNFSRFVSGIILRRKRVSL